MRRVIVLAVLVMMMGCVSTPEGVKMAPQTEKVADTTAEVATTALPLVAPYASVVPYGGLILALATGILATYLKARPHLVAKKEIIAGIQAYNKGDSLELSNELSKSTSPKTKAIIAATRAGV